MQHRGDRYLEILEKYGADTVKEAARIITDQTEERVRKALADIPDGTYEAESFLDGYGDETVPIKVRVTIKGSDMLVDYTGCGKQVKGPINSTKVGLIAARSAVKMLTDPQYYVTQGSFRPVKYQGSPRVHSSVPAQLHPWRHGVLGLPQSSILFLKPWRRLSPTVSPLDTRLTKAISPLWRRSRQRAHTGFVPVSVVGPRRPAA